MKLTECSKLANIPDGSGVIHCFSEPFFWRIVCDKAETLARMMRDSHCGGLPDEGAEEDARRLLSDAIRSKWGIVMILDSIVACEKSRHILTKCCDALPASAENLRSEVDEWLGKK
jgi:hypothetical protein